MLYLYKVVNPSSSATWIHIHSKEYLQTRPWLISMLSFNFLAPNYKENTLIHIPNGTCPHPKSDSITSDVYISKKLKELSFIGSKHVVAKAEITEYSAFSISSDNKFRREVISFINGNVSILFCFAFMIIAVIILLYFLWGLCKGYKKSYEESYEKCIEDARTLSETKRDHQDSESIFYHKSEKSLKKVRLMKKYLEVGLWKSTVKNDEEESTKVSKEKRVYLSVFKIIDLEIDEISRNWSNSLALFIKDIKVDQNHFSSHGNISEEDFGATSVELHYFTDKYSEYWTKKGLIFKKIQENESLFEKYGLKIEHRQGSFTSAFVGIRWKTFYEKARYSSNKGNSIETNTNEESSVSSFLSFECTTSLYESEYILSSDLKKRYDAYCFEIDQSNEREDILNSKELISFGGKFREKFSIPFIRGVAKRIFSEIQSPRKFLG